MGGVGEQDPGVRLREQLTDFRGAQPCVDRRAGQTGLVEGDFGDDQLGAVGGEGGDAVTPVQAQAAQCGSEAVAVVVEFRVGQPDGAAHHGFGIGLMVGCPAHVPPEIHRVSKLSEHCVQ